MTEMPPLTDDELDELDNSHCDKGGITGLICTLCGYSYPCPTVRAIAELRALRDIDPAGLHPACMAIQAEQTAEIDRLAQQNAALMAALVTMQLEFAGEHQYDGWREDTAGMFCASCETPESLPHRPGCAWWAAYEPSVKLVGTYSENAARVRGAE